MDMALYDKYTLTDEKEKDLWENCYFVFDSSALLDFYSYPETTRKEIYSEIFNKIKDKLWIPSHVQYEYLKNRQSVIRKPIKEKYDPLIDILNLISNCVEETRKRLNELKERTENAVKHPHIEQSDILNIQTIIDRYADDVNMFDKNVKEKIEKQKEEILKLEENDTVLSSFDKYFAVGKDCSFEQIMEITKEGKHRYEFRIPPGYKDQKEKDGIQIFGDLIIWKQILDFAFENKSNIIFICNDLKSDWCILDDSISEKRIKSPREELITEFAHKTGKIFWMYSQDQFIYKSNIILGSRITREQVAQIWQVITAKIIKDAWVGTIPYMFASPDSQGDTFIKIWNNSAIDGQVTVDVTSDDGSVVATASLATLEHGTIGIYWARDIAAATGVPLNSAFGAVFTVNAPKDFVTAFAVQRRLGASDRVLPIYTR